MFFERPESGELAILVHLNLDNERQPEDPREFEELVLSAGGDPAGEINGSRSTPHSHYFVGTGKLEEIRTEIARTGAELVIFNHNLSPRQERNVENSLCCRVLDRTGLILDIFAQRAQTHEGKLQVELAQLDYMSTRLIRGWTHLERQKGGIGLRGPGETQLETDRRLLRARIKSIKKRLGKVKSQRHQSRRSRRRADLPTISLVGYTNAGKSTLFNRLTGAEVYVADQLFATLDPTMRAIKLPSQGTVIFADTVGFISHLPHKLIEAFRATLEEAANATLLLEVVDANSSELADNIQRVEEVLGDIEADEIPTLRVYNKIDSLDGIEPHIERDVNGVAVAVWLSAATGAGLDLLCEALKERLAKDSVEVSCYLAPQSGRLRALFYEADSVLAEHIQNDGATIVDIRMPKEKWHRLLKSEGIEAADLIVEKTHSEGQCSELPRDRLVLAG